jgi:hypothetical protein
MEAKYSIH